MTTLETRVVPVGGGRATLGQLARIEARRFALHPLLWAGLVLGVVTSAGERGPIELDYQVIPAFFIGVLGLVVANRLTVSTRRSRAVLDAAPVPDTTRTAALCLACLVPATAGLALVLLHRAFVLADPFPGWAYGTYGPVDRVVITMVLPVIACLGAPLLGVAVGRWLRFPGAGLLTVLTLLCWSALASYLPAQNMDAGSLPARVLHMTTPYTAFGTDPGNGTGTLTVVRSYTGSPVWFAVWTLCLSGLVAAAALWWRADVRTRGLLRRAGVVLGVVALVALSLSVATGSHDVHDSSRSGTVPVAPAADGA